MRRIRNVLAAGSLVLLVSACGGKQEAVGAASASGPGSPPPAESAAVATTSNPTPPATSASESDTSLATTTSGSNPWAPPTTTAPAPAVPTIEPVKSGPVAGSAAKGASFFAAKCASCHGTEARGDTAMGKKYGMKDFRSPDVRALTTSDLDTIMKLGRGKLSEGAHPKANMTAQDIGDMIAFVNSLK